MSYVRTFQLVVIGFTRISFESLGALMDDMSTVIRRFVFGT